MGHHGLGDLNALTYWECEFPPTHGLCPLSSIGEGLLAKASPTHESGSTKLQARVSFKDFVM